MKNQIEALIDRLADIPLPHGCPYMFEGVRTPQELRAFGDQLRELSQKNFGWAGPEFVHQLTRALKRDHARRRVFRPLTRASADRRQKAYRDAADGIKSLGGRDLTRITDRFATVYVAGCLAISFELLPFTEREILEALWTCERDHVAFIDRELGTGATAASSVSVGAAGGRVPGKIIARTLFARLRKFILDNRKTGFIDLRVPPAERLKIAKPKGYIGEHGGQSEYWLTGPQFEIIAGGAAEARDLKQELAKRRLLKTGRRGSGVSYVVKRQALGFPRTFVVAIRRPLQPKRPRAKRKVAP
jgi:hypothetical protein